MKDPVNVPQSFGFNVATRITFRVGAAKGVADEARSLGGTKALVVSEKGVIAAGIVEPIWKRLADSGLEPRLFDGFSPNPKDYKCLEGLCSPHEDQQAQGGEHEES